MIMKSLHHREKPITPRITDTMPLISKDIAKPPWHPGYSGRRPEKPVFWGKKHFFVNPLSWKRRLGKMKVFRNDG
jgi:hypothetical protein